MEGLSADLMPATASTIAGTCDTRSDFFWEAIDTPTLEVDQRQKQKRPNQNLVPKPSYPTLIRSIAVRRYPRSGIRHKPKLEALRAMDNYHWTVLPPSGLAGQGRRPQIFPQCAVIGPKSHLPPFTAPYFPSLNEFSSPHPSNPRDTPNSSPDPL